MNRLYPNLELAQAKSSLKYRSALPMDPFLDRPSSPTRDNGISSHEASPSRRHHHVPSFSHLQSVHTFETISDDDDTTAVSLPTASNPRADTATGGRRRRRGELSPSPSLLPEHQIHRTSSLAALNNRGFLHDRVNRRSTTASGHGGGSRYSRQTHANADEVEASYVSPSLTRKLSAIDHIIAQADVVTVASETKAVDPRWQTVFEEHGEILYDSSEQPGEGSRASSSVVASEPLHGTATATAADDSVPVSPLARVQSQRKVNFLLNQRDKPGTPTGANRRGEIVTRRRQMATSSSSSSSLVATSSHQVSTRYLITTPPDTGTGTAAATLPFPGPASPPALSPLLVKQSSSKRHVNDSRVMEFVDGVNMKPRAASVSLDKQLRRVSLVSFDQKDGKLQVNNSSEALRRKQMFGIYSIREIMAVIRLFWFLDGDGSGDITLDELVLHRHFFDQLGHGDLSAVFRELDGDNSGSVTLTELLRVCFRHANDHQLQAMLTLAKVGNVREYLTGHHSNLAHLNQDDATTKAQYEDRVEFREIFHLFDQNGDGHINRMELLEALEIDNDMFSPALETMRESWAESVKRMERAKSGGLTKEDIERFYGEFDKDNDGTLDFEEFIKLMQAAAS